MFVERYVNSLNSSDLRDDEFHHATDPLHASASADLGAGAVLGSLLVRVKFAGGARKTFESGAGDIAQLLRAWIPEVAKRGSERKWVKIKGEWDVAAAVKLYDLIARESLAYWLDGRCKPCGGTGISFDRRKCPCCDGSGREAISSNGFVADRIADMVSDLEGIYQAHSGRAARKLRRGG